MLFSLVRPGLFVLFWGPSTGTLGNGGMAVLAETLTRQPKRPGFTSLAVDTSGFRYRSSRRHVHVGHYVSRPNCFCVFRSFSQPPLPTTHFCLLHVLAAVMDSALLGTW